MGSTRTITRDGADVLVSYPLAWDKSYAWRHLLAHPPANVQQPRRQSHTQRWTKAHTAEAWAWRAPAAVVAATEDPTT